MDAIPFRFEELGLQLQDDMVFPDPPKAEPVPFESLLTPGIQPYPCIIRHLLKFPMSER